MRLLTPHCHCSSRHAVVCPESAWNARGRAYVWGWLKAVLSRVLFWACESGGKMGFILKSNLRYWETQAFFVLLHSTSFPLLLLC